MQLDHVVKLLDDAGQAKKWLASLGVCNTARAHANLMGMAQAGITVDLMCVICDQLQDQLREMSDPDMALNNLERFVCASRSPLALGALIERDVTAMPILLRIFSTSQHLSDLIIRDPESYDLLRLTEGQPVALEALIEDFSSEIDRVHDDRAAMMVIRRFKHRETLRVAYGDIVGEQRIDQVTSQISYIAEAILEGTLRYCRRQLGEKIGVPRAANGDPARFVILALGKLGGGELNYSSDIDLIMLFDVDGTTDGARSKSNREYFDRLARHVFKILTEPTELGIVYRIDMRLRPNGGQGPMVNDIESMLHYYEFSGRTWERQAFVKARSVAGDVQLGQELLSRLEPWIYRNYLSRADITGIKALKRRIEQRAKRELDGSLNVKTGRGGIRDVEFVIQFLQLLNGSELPGVRTTNTLDGISRLESVGSLTLQESSILQENYAFLRKIEHRLQIMFDLQTHTMPDDDEELRKLAIRMGYRGKNDATALEEFKMDLKEKTELNRKILDHLLHDAFESDDEVEPEVDLILDPEPSQDDIRAVLGKYGFKDVGSAYRNLMALARERIPFLSTRRCRHFLAAIAPRLLEQILHTPDPDLTLLNLSQVSDSLGGKGVLWELFSFNQPTLRLYVTLCASSPYLAGILTSSPGMIDELMDSLVLQHLPTLDSLRTTLDDLTRGAEDVELILHSFKNSQHLNVGVRDILGKDDVRRTHQALSDIAEVCLTKVTEQEYDVLVEKYGTPEIRGGRFDGKACELTTVAMGKLGGREPNYHSDLDVVFLYEASGYTRHRRAEKSTSNQHFFSQLAARIIKVVTRIGPHGRLYELDPRLRPTGKSGALAVSLDEFDRYFYEGRGQQWERQALCKARPIYGSLHVRDQAMYVIRKAILDKPWEDSMANEIRQMRHRLEGTATRSNLKRGFGGTVDIEFIIQMLQLKNAADNPTVLTPGTLDAAAELRASGCLSDDDFGFLNRSYRFLRSVEAGLRLMNTTARHDMPRSSEELEKLAFLLGYESPEQLARLSEEYRDENRKRFNKIFDATAAMR